MAESRPLKTLHLTNAYHATSGGISTFYRALLEGANRLGRPMRLVVPGEADREERVGTHGLIHHVRAPTAPAFDRRYRMLLPHRYLFPGAPLQQILAREKPDVVEICDKYALPYLGGQLRQGWMKGVPGHESARPLVVGLSCERLDDNLCAFVMDNAACGWFARTAMRRIYFELFDEHIANSDYTADELRAVADGHKVARGIHVLPMGVAVDAFDPGRRSPEARAALLNARGLPADARLLLYAGRLSPEKNVTLLADMMEQLEPSYRLLIAGAGPLEAWLRREIGRRAGDRVAFLGHLRDRAELAGLYANVDAFVHPNPREPFGIGPLEAMASGTPVVCPDRGGVRSYASAENAWVVPATGGAFAAAVEEVFREGEERRRRVRNARQTAEEFAWPSVADRFFALYDRLHAEWRRRPTSARRGRRVS